MQLPTERHSDFYRSPNQDISHHLTNHLKMVQLVFLSSIIAFLLLLANTGLMLSAEHGSPCNEGGTFAPCACKTLMTGVSSGESIIEFPEGICDEKENKRRKEKGVIGPKYFCFQLRKKVTIYRDVENNPIEVAVKHKAGCELRCLEKKCKEGN